MIAAVIVIASVVLLALAFCQPFDPDEDDEDDGRGVSVVQTTDDDRDCDDEDRRGNEVPDCGFIISRGGRMAFVPYSWVKAGKAHPPRGWSRAAEIAAANPPKTVKPKPATTRRR